jgi:hypothetical protein
MSTNNVTAPATIIEMLLGMGCREWKKGAHHRVYVPVAVGAAAIGLRVNRYGSGNVSSATLDGASISNGCAREILACLDGGYYDVVTGKFTGMAEGVAPKLSAQFAALAPQAVAS